MWLNKIHWIVFFSCSFGLRWSLCVLAIHLISFKYSFLIIKTNEYPFLSLFLLIASIVQQQFSRLILINKMFTHVYCCVINVVFLWKITSFPVWNLIKWFKISEVTLENSLDCHLFYFNHGHKIEANCVQCQSTKSDLSFNYFIIWLVFSLQKKEEKTGCCDFQFSESYFTVWIRRCQT